MLANTLLEQANRLFTIARLGIDQRQADFSVCKGAQGAVEQRCNTIKG
jgi:hypothetical protein